MATLTQVRLAPLTRWYLFSRRPYESSGTCQSLQAAKYTRNLQWKKQVRNQSVSVPLIGYEGISSEKDSYTPKSVCYSLLQDRKKIMSDNQVKLHFNSLTRNQFMNSCTQPKRSTTDYCKRFHNLIGALSNQYLASTTLNKTSLFGIKIESTSFHDISYKDHESKYRSKNSGQAIHRGYNRTLTTLLALLGLFKQKETGQIEEERARLNDAEKWEKMGPIERKIAIGVLWMYDQEYVKASQLFHEALELAQKEQDKDQERLILNLIATNYFENEEWDKAEKLFIDLIKRMIDEDELAPTAPAILEISLKLASIYSKSQTTHEKALKGFKFVINSLLYDLDDILNSIDDLDIQSLGDEKRNALALLGWSYDWFAKHLLNMNDYNGAADMLQRALQISSKVLGQQHDQTLILLNDIGTTLAMNNAPERGQTFIMKAVEGAIETQSKELASFYVNLGLVNLKLRKLQEAKRYCEYSIELVNKNREHHNSHEVIDLSKSCLNEIERLIELEDK